MGEIHFTRKVQLVHSDVCGPISKDFIGGSKYFVTFIDDFSRCCSVYFIKHKSEVLDKFKEFEAVTTNDCGKRIGVLCSDNGGEYLSDKFKEYLELKQIHHELTLPYSLQQNGVTERMNRMLMESARSMMSHTKLPDKYWAEAVATAAYVKSRTPTNYIKQDRTPFENWYGKKPNVSNLKVFGCIAYAHVPDLQM